MKVTVENPSAVSQPVLRKLKATLGRLRNRCGIDRDVVVRFRKMKTLHGQAWVDQDGVGRIDVDSSRCVWCMKDTIVHEWAHLMNPKANHGPAWGETYARAYRAVWPG